MQINADFNLPVLSRAADRDWVPSPMAGVERQMLDRVGDEVARATSLVRYAPGSEFSAHAHDLGEEFLVLDGVFADEHGDYPTGTYMRNPPGTAHSPKIGPDGCVIFVKLRQFDVEDLKPVHEDITDEDRWAELGGGLATLPLHGYRQEDVFAVRIDAGAVLERALPGGAEVLVLSGSVSAARTGIDLANNQTLELETGDWLRLPAGAHLHLNAGSEAARLYLKTGHLPPG